MEAIIIAMFLLLFIYLLIKYKWKGLIIIGLVISFLGGSYYYFIYVAPLNKKKEMVNDYFNYFEENFDFHDSLDNYGWKDDRTKQPKLRFTFEEYGNEYDLTNSAVKTLPKESGIRVLRNHIYYHYAAYIIERFAYDKKIGNDFLRVEEYFSEKGYECGLDIMIYFPKENEGYELYIDKSIQPNIRINRSNKKVSLEEEMNFYKGKSMEEFDYQKYMEYFDYRVVLIGYYSPLEDKKQEPLNKKELDKVVKEAMQNERIEIVLKEFDEQ
ncbi:hypothetical protein ACYSNR_10010 [Enterococcus sp. LJL128]